MNIEVVLNEIDARIRLWRDTIHHPHDRIVTAAVVDELQFIYDIIDIGRSRAYARKYAKQTVPERE